MKYRMTPQGLKRLHIVDGSYRHIALMLIYMGVRHGEPTAMLDRFLTQFPKGLGCRHHTENSYRDSNAWFSWAKRNGYVMEIKI